MDSLVKCHPQVTTHSSAPTRLVPQRSIIFSPIDRAVHNTLSQQLRSYQERREGGWRQGREEGGGGRGGGRGGGGRWGGGGGRGDVADRRRGGPREGAYGDRDGYREQGQEQDRGRGRGYERGGEERGGGWREERGRGRDGDRDREWDGEQQMRGGGRGRGRGGDGGVQGRGWGQGQQQRERDGEGEAPRGRYGRDERDGYGYDGRREREYGQRKQYDREREDEREEDDAEEEEWDGEEEGEGEGSRRRRGGAGSTAPGNPRDELQGEALYGVFPVLAALKAGRRTVHRAFLQEASQGASSGKAAPKRKDAGLLRQAEALLAARGVPVERRGRHHLNLLSNDRPHGGLVLDASPLGWEALEEFPTAQEAMAAAQQAGAPPPVWVALDEVTDPQNLGAVVRSAYCLGAAGVLACARNCAPLSPVVSKASAGALEALPLHSCRNLPRTLADARAKGWAVLGAAAGQGSTPVDSVAVGGPTVLVLGSEGFGLRTNVRRACSGLVRVEMSGGTGASGTGAGRRGGGSGTGGAAHGQQEGQREEQEQAEEEEGGADVEGPGGPGGPGAGAGLHGLVDSLNVSVAAGILMHSLLRSAAAAAAGAAGAGAQGPRGEEGAASP